MLALLLCLHILGLYSAESIDSARADFVRVFLSEESLCMQAAYGGDNAVHSKDRTLADFDVDCGVRKDRFHPPGHPQIVTNVHVDLLGPALDH